MAVSGVDAGAIQRAALSRRAALSEVCARGQADECAVGARPRAGRAGARAICSAAQTLVPEQTGNTGNSASATVTFASLPTNAVLQHAEHDPGSTQSRHLGRPCAA